MSSLSPSRSSAQLPRSRSGRGRKLFIHGGIQLQVWGGVRKRQWVGEPQDLPWQDINSRYMEYLYSMKEGVPLQENY